MTDKKKIREEVKRLYNQSLADENRQADRGLERAANVSYGKSEACKELLSFIDSMQEEPVSEDLEKEIDRAHRIFYDEVGWDSDEGARAYVADWFAHYFANWQKHRMEANRLAHCNSISNEQAELEQKFLDEHLDKHDRMPTFLDAIEYGMRLQKEQMMKNVVLETEVLRDSDGDGVDTPYESWLTLANTEIPELPESLGLKEGDKVKILIVKSE